jgi:hypothetical protein
MDDAGHERGLALLAAHCASLDPCAATARDRLDSQLGPELAQLLVQALSTTPGSRRLRARPVFAA